MMPRLTRLPLATFTLVAACATPATAGASSTPAQPVDSTVLVSHAADGVTADGFSYHASTDDAGRFIAYASSASDIAVDGVGYRGVFLYDRSTASSTLISRTIFGGPPHAGSDHPSVSGDGRFIAYESRASRLVAGDTNARFDVFLYDRVAGATTLVSSTAGGTSGSGQSTAPAVDGTGRYVAFASKAGDLVAGDTNELEDVFLRDTVSGVTTLVSHAPDGGPALGGRSNDPSITDDGRYVVFWSVAKNLVPGADASHGDVFIYDTETATTSLVSHEPGGKPGDNASFAPAISGDGRFVAYTSAADDLVGADPNGMTDVFRWSRTSDRTTIVSQDHDGGPANGPSFFPSISDSGAVVAFCSDATNLAQPDSNGARDVFAFDARSGATSLLSATEDGGVGNGDSDGPAISGNDRYVAFESLATDLAGEDRNSTWDTYLRRRR